MLNRTFTLLALANKVGAKIRGDAELEISGLNTLQDAQQSQLSFLANPAYKKHLADTSASAVIISPALVDDYAGTALVHPNPYLAYAQLSILWDEVASFEANISTSANIDDRAQLGRNVFVGAGASIAEGVIIADDVYIGQNVVIGANSIIGSGSRLYPNVVLYHNVVIGANCTVQSGAILGSDGFGFAPTGTGSWQRISQLGGLVIGDSVEIGANTTIDRGALNDTQIGNNVILDNQIQIAHNVVIGDNTAIAACSAVAGSTTIGKNCVIGGACGVAGHLNITDGVHVTAMTMVIKSLPEAGVYSSGTGVQSNKEWKRSIARLRRLDGTETRLKSVERKLSELTKEQGE